MSIFGAMHTSVSGMNAQSNRLSVLSDNIANSDTVGYKSASAQFETVLDEQSASAFTSSGVTTRVRYGISQQGLLQNTTTGTNLAVQGNGFFVVADAGGAPLLTRAGAFVPDASGHLVNTAGFQLMGIDISAGDPGAAVGALASLTPVQINTFGLIATPSTSGQLAWNLPSTAASVPAANLPSTNAAGATYSAKSSVVAYDNLGAKVTLDIYLSKTAGNTWEAAVYNAADATGGGFPYSSGALTTASLSFNATTGALTGTSALTVAVPGGATMALNVAGTTQLAADFAVTNSQTNGNAPSAFKQITVDENGIVSALYGNGTSIPKFRIPLANVPSPDNLRPLTGNVYAVSTLSGAAFVGASGSSGMGKIQSSTLESSTVDIASELTNMIETQRAYTANSKAFQIGTDMADVLVNLKV